MNFETISLEIKKTIAHLTLNRPSVYNALNEQMHFELQDALGQIKNNTDIRVLVIAGTGKAFCTGQDLNDRSVNNGDESIDLGESIERKYNPLISAIYNLPIPTIAYVNGITAGAGVGIALACDFTIVSERAYFLQAFCKIGLVPDSANTFFLPRLVGMAKAKELCMLGDKLSAQDALKYGLITRVHSDENIAKEVEQLATSLSTAPTYGLSLIKQALHSSLDNTFEQQIELEKQFQRKAGFSSDYKEGVNAFLNKRVPNFQGQ